MSTATAQDKYSAIRALNELDARRAAGDLPSRTGMFAILTEPMRDTSEDDTVPMLPALLRPQA
jgi:hypothetical protein